MLERLRINIGHESLTLRGLGLESLPDLTAASPEASDSDPSESEPEPPSPLLSLSELLSEPSESATADPQRNYIKDDDTTRQTRPRVIPPDPEKSESSEDR